MRILARLHAYPPTHCAGAEMMAHTLLRALAQRGHDVEVWLTKHNGQRKVYDYEGVQVVPAAVGRDFARQARTAGAVVSHLESVRDGAAAARGWGRPLIVLCHNTFPATFRAIGSGTTALAVYNSQWMAASAAMWFAENPKAAKPAAEVIVRPPVFAKEYRVSTPGDCITLINLFASKGGNVFWDIAERMPDHKFLGVTGAYGEQVIREAPNVEVVDHVPAAEMPARVYGRTRVLVMPSAYESWGRTGVEALASGIPVVACPTPGLRESLGPAGVFVERDDLDGWVAALTALDDPETWQAASDRAKRRSRQLDPRQDLARWCEAIEGLAVR
jgi:hypothetical protein